MGIGMNIGGSNMILTIQNHAIHNYVDVASVHIYNHPAWQVYLTHDKGP